MSRNTEQETDTMSIKSFCFFACAAIFCAGLILLFAFFRNGNDEAQDLKQLDTKNPVAFLPEETAIEIARRAFAESPIATEPSPIVKRKDSQTVVYLPRWQRPDSPPREFPKGWRPVWIDNATREVIPSPASVLSETEALEIAKAEVGNNYYDRQGKIIVERNSTCFVFTFPFPYQGEPGTHLGPDFAFKVCIDSETKAVLFVEAGY